MANVDLGTAHGKVEIEYDGSGLKKASQDIDATKSKGEGAGRSFDKVGNVMGGAGIAIAAGIGLAVKSAADFEKTLSGVQAVSGASQGQMEALRKKALDLGRDTQFSASEAAGAIEELAKAGVSLPDILNGAADAAVALAAAGGVALPQAATIASNAMNQFGLTAKEMPGIADLIAGAANASAIDVTDFGQSLSQVGAVAHSTGLSFSETAIAIAVLGNAGVKGSDAGTSLKQMLIQLANPTDKAANLMKQLGFNAFDSNGAIKSLADISQGLQTSMRDLTPQARNAALAIIFGSDAARAGAIFYDQGAAGVNKMAASMFKVKAADVAKARMDNLSGSVEQFKGSLETAMIKLGEFKQGPLRGLIDGLTGLINGFSNLSSGTQQTILTIASITGGFLLFGAGLIKTVKFIQELTVALRAIAALKGITAVFGAISTGIELMNGSLASLAANPIVLIIAAIVLLVIAIVIAYKKSETFRNIVNGVFTGIKDVAVAVFNFLKPFILGAFDAIKSGLSSFASGFMKVWNAIWPVLHTIVKIYFTLIKLEITIAMTVIRAVITVAMNIIKGVWGIWSFFYPIVAAVFKLIVDVIRLVLGLIKLNITIFAAVIYQLWKQFWNGISLVASAAWSVIKTIVSVGIGAVKAVISAVMTAIHFLIDKTLAGIHALFNTWIGKKVVAGVRVAVNGIKAAFNGIKTAVVAVGGFFKSIYDTVASRVAAAIRVIAGIGSKVKNALKGAAGWLLNAGKDIILGLIRGIDSMIRSLIKKVSSITNIVKSFKGPPKVDKVLLTPAGQWIMESLLKGIDNRIPDLEKKLASIGPGNIVQAITASSSVTPIVSGVIASATSSVAPANLAFSAPQTPVIDYNVLAKTMVVAMQQAGVGNVSLDGELLTSRTNRISGRKTQQMRRTR